MSYVESPCRTFEAAGAIGDRILVKLSAGRVDVAGVGEQAIGVTERPAYAAGDRIAVRLLSAQGTIEVTAGAPVAAGAELFGIAGGKVDDADPTGGIKYGIALEAAGADGDIIEMLPLTL